MKLALFYNKNPGTVGGYFHRAFLALGHQVDHFSVSDANQCRGTYDLYLRVDHGDYSEPFPKHLKPCAFYVVDTHLNRSWKSIRRQAPQYDYVFCVQRRAAQRLPNAHWIPLGCDPEIHAGSPAKKQHDLGFVGTDGGVPRKFYLQELRERYPNSYIGQALYTDMARIYRESRIGFHYIECTSPLKDHMSMRVYEILASGTLLFANALEPGTFESIGLNDGEQLVVYNSGKELFERVRYYLDHEEERERIASRGQACVLSKHAYRHRAQSIVDIVAGKPIKEHPHCHQEAVK